MHTFYNNIPRERNWKTSPYRKQFLSSKKPLKYWNYKSISIQHETLNLHLESNSLPSLCNFLLSNFIFVIFVLCKLSKEEVPCYIFFSARIHGHQRKQFANTLRIIDKDLFLFTLFVVTDDDSFLMDALLFLACE